MILSDIISILEKHAPLNYQESYDNSGLTVGDPAMEISGAILTLDVTEEVITEAIDLNFNLIISHHPVVFSGIKKITGRNATEKILIKAIQNNIALYAVHTNIDSVRYGVNSKICEKIGLENCSILAPVSGELLKLVTFVPSAQADQVRMAMFEAGAGHIGNYDQCSYNIEGYGTFRGLENTKPFAGKQGELHFEKEVRIETIFPKNLQNKITEALLKSHPYEEVAYDIYPLANVFDQVGMGMKGDLTNPVDETEFLKLLKSVFETKVIRHTKLLGKKVNKVAVCGGSGSFLINKAIASGADVFVTGDVKYHQFFEAENKLVIADIGHFESEQFTKEIFYDLLKKNFPKFAIRLSEVNTNPIKYY
ncbi:MAG: Nif3-like dinuclear metal center hexameric protein [Bacteroidales bacterium]|nr:Nif3-like dinuclear metal center hexameric protein [Bacteroidales bacterium]